VVLQFETHEIDVFQNQNSREGEDNKSSGDIQIKENFEYQDKGVFGKIKKGEFHWFFEALVKVTEEKKSPFTIMIKAEIPRQIFKTFG
jgi:hypothetical protein